MNYNYSKNENGASPSGGIRTKRHTCRCHAWNDEKMSKNDEEMTKAECHSSFSMTPGFENIPQSGWIIMETRTFTEQNVSEEKRFLMKNGLVVNITSPERLAKSILSSLLSSFKFWATFVSESFCALLSIIPFLRSRKPEIIAYEINEVEALLFLCLCPNFFQQGSKVGPGGKTNSIDSWVRVRVRNNISHVGQCVKNVRKRK